LNGYDEESETDGGRYNNVDTWKRDDWDGLIRGSDVEQFLGDRIEYDTDNHGFVNVLEAECKCGHNSFKIYEENYLAIFEAALGSTIDNYRPGLSLASENDIKKCQKVFELNEVDYCYGGKLSFTHCG